MENSVRVGICVKQIRRGRIRSGGRDVEIQLTSLVIPFKISLPLQNQV